jgi:hypothetical protein
MTKDVASNKRADVQALGAILLAWVAAVLLVNPSGNFPLNDDWAFAASVRSLVRDHRFRLDAWTSMPLVVQTLWGSLWGSVLGMSPAVLRLSTAFLALIANWTLYLSLRSIGSPVRVALLLALGVAMSPVFVNLSFTFMTDIPSLSLFVLSVALFIRWFSGGAPGHLAMGLAMAFLSMFVRQLGLALFLGFAPAFILRKGARPRTVVLAVLPALLAYLALQAYGWVVARTIGLPYFYPQKTNAVLIFLGKLAAFRFGVLEYPVFYLTILAFHLCLAIAPLSPLLGAFKRRPRGELVRIGLLASLLAAMMVVLRHRLVIPGGILTAGGSGPLTLYQDPPPLPPWWAATLAFASALGVWTLACLSIELGARFRGLDNRAQSILVFLSVTAMAYLFPLSVAMGMAIFDRYTLPLVVLVVLAGGLLTAGPASRRSVQLTAAMVSAVAIFAVLASHDYLAWNRTRWMVIDQTLRTVARADLDGGIEYRGAAGFMFAPILDPHYALSFAPLVGYDEVRRAPVSGRILPSTPPAVLLSRRRW